MAVGAYQQSGGDIGTLLRRIQEEKSSSVLNAAPATDPNSPIREQIQGPLLSPEAPGGTRNISLRPEGVGSTGAESMVSTEGGSAQQTGQVVSAVAPSARAAAPPTGFSGGPTTASPSPIKASAISMPRIGTSISTAPKVAPRASSISAVSKPTPTPTPSPKTKMAVQSRTPSTSKVGALGALTTGSSIATRILPALAESTVGKLIKIPLGIINYGGAQRSVSKPIKS